MKSELWFNYVVANKNLWANGFTLKRLEKVKPLVLSDKDIMFDLLKRHGADNLSPEEMKAKDTHTYNHCIGNFTCNIMYKMMNEGIIKTTTNK